MTCGGPLSERLCCKSLFAPLIANFSSCRRGFRVNMSQMEFLSTHRTVVSLGRVRKTKRLCKEASRFSEPKRWMKPRRCLSTKLNRAHSRIGSTYSKRGQLSPSRRMNLAQQSCWLDCWSHYSKYLEANQVGGLRASD